MDIAIARILSLKLCSLVWFQTAVSSSDKSLMPVIRLSKSCSCWSSIPRCPGLKEKVEEWWAAWSEWASKSSSSLSSDPLSSPNKNWLPLLLYISANRSNFLVKTLSEKSTGTISCSLDDTFKGVIFPQVLAFESYSICICPSDPSSVWLRDCVNSGT